MSNNAAVSWIRYAARRSVAELEETLGMMHTTFSLYIFCQPVIFRYLR